MKPANPNHMHLTLDQAEYWARQGLMTDDEWARYKHAWQIGAPRFATQLCRCDECKKVPGFPISPWSS